MSAGATMPAEAKTVNSSNSKFHRLFGKELCVALEATLEVGSGELEFNTELFGGRPSQDLLYRSGDCWRAYSPAVSSGDIRENDEAVIRFVPWFTGPNVLFYRLCFRGRPLFQRDDFRWLAFGRYGEEKPFGFNPSKPFINLDFYSRLQGEFKPLYVRVEEGRNRFVYFVIRAEWSEDGPMLKLARVNGQDTPPCLQAAKP